MASILLTINPQNQNGQPPTDIEIPTPENGNEFTLQEFYTLGAEFSKNRKRSQFTDVCMKRKHIPVKRTKAFELLMLDKENLPSE